MIIQQKVFDGCGEGSEAKSTEQTGLKAGAEAEKTPGDETGVGAIANI